MTPIINPIWFYLIDIIESADNLFFILSVLSAIATIVMLIIIVTEEEDPETAPGIFKLTKKIFIVYITSIILSVLTPTPDTCYKMMAASMVTPDNIAAVGETATDIVDYIVESVDTLLEESK